MKTIADKLEWIFDYYIAYFLYNPNKIDQYNQFLIEKWEFFPEEPHGINKNKIREKDWSKIDFFPEFDSSDWYGANEPVRKKTPENFLLTYFSETDFTFNSKELHSVLAINHYLWWQNSKFNF